MTDGWSQGITGAARYRIAQPSARQQELRKIYEDPRYPKMRRRYEKELREAFGDSEMPMKFKELYGVSQKHPTDFIRYYRENEKQFEKPTFKLKDNKLRDKLDESGDRHIENEIMDTYRNRTDRSMGPKPNSRVSEFLSRILSRPQSRIDAEVFSKSFFDYYDENKLSNSLIINVRQEDRIEMDVYCKGQPEGKTYAYDRIDDILSMFHKDVKELLAQSNATTILSIGDSLQGYAHKEVFKSLGLPVIRTFATDPSEIHQIGPRSEVSRKKILQMEGENSVVLNGLPTDEAGLKELGKDLGNLKLWQAADSSIREVVKQRHSAIFEASAASFRDVLLLNGGKNVIYVIADTNGESIRFPDGSSVSAKDINRWEQRSADTSDLPLVVFIGCNMANIGHGQPGEIIRALLRKGYISGSLETNGFIRPDRAEKVIDQLLRRKESSDPNDLLPTEIEGPTVHRVLKKTTEGV